MQMVPGAVQIRKFLAVHPMQHSWLTIINCVYTATHSPHNEAIADVVENVPD